MNGRQFYQCVEQSMNIDAFQFSIFLFIDNISMPLSLLLRALIKIWTTKAKASAASRSILQDFLGSVKALAWLELECYIRFLSG